MQVETRRPSIQLRDVVRLLASLVLVTACSTEPTAIDGRGPTSAADPTPVSSHVALGFGDVVTGTGAGGAVDSVATDTQIGGGTDQLYLAQVDIHKDQVVSHVTGDTLTWTLVGAKTGDRGVVRVEVWKAFGSPASPFTVTAHMANSAETVTLTVVRYQGAVRNVEDVSLAGTCDTDPMSCLSGPTDNADVEITTTSTTPTPGAVHWVALNARNRIISGEDPDYTVRGEVGAGSGGDEVNGYTLDHVMSSSGPDTFTATLNNPADWAVVALVINPAVPPVSHGFWITKSELDNLPDSGMYWTDPAKGGEVYDVASSPWPDIDLEENDGKAELYALAGALVFARLYPDSAAHSHRVDVADYIEELTLEDLTHGSAALAWARNTGAFVIAADLINLEEYDPALNAEFVAFLKDLLVEPTSGGGMSSVLNGARDRAANPGAWARWTSILITKYVGDTTNFDDLVDRMAFWLGDRTAHTDEWDWPEDPDSLSWHEDPGDPDTYRAIVRKDVVRDGNVFDGILPEEMRRDTANLPYDPNDFPNEYGTLATPDSRYVEEALDAALGTVEVLRRLGYPAYSWSDSALGRAATRLHHFADVHPDKGWLYFTEGHEASRPLVQFLYAHDLPTNKNRTQFGGATKGYAFTHWTHCTTGGQACDRGIVP